MKAFYFSLLFFFLANINVYPIEPQYKILCHEDEWVAKVEKKKFKCIASSVKETEGSYSYNCENVFDKDKSTCWVPKQGSEKNGIYEFIILKIPYGCQGIRITNGLAKNESLYYANNRVKKLYLGFIVKLDPSEEDACPPGIKYHLTYQTITNELILLKDSMKSQSLIFGKVISNFNWKDNYYFKYKKDVYLVVAIWDIYKGTKYNDTCISEIEIIK
ncbi:MAG TPA: hypothetical protein PKN50_16445 [Spirochaetota bacterium]|nr:hypothetical protein [Spirochaetota bacterium]HPV43587.1 hypothetical protein [Spirochaetota bacterium]